MFLSWCTHFYKLLSQKLHQKIWGSAKTKGWLWSDLHNSLGGAVQVSSYKEFAKELLLKACLFDGATTGFCVLFLPSLFNFPITNISLHLLKFALIPVKSVGHLHHHQTWHEGNQACNYLRNTLLTTLACIFLLSNSTRGIDFASCFCTGYHRTEIRNYSVFTYHGTQACHIFSLGMTMHQ